MKVNRINSPQQDLNFKRRPTTKEMKVYTQAINKGLALLDKKMDIIIHNASAPSVPKENTGIGSLFSSTTQTKLIPFLKEHGFLGIQQEPNNLRKMSDASPYAPESAAKNIFMIPLEKLTTSKYGKILSEKTFNDIVSRVPKADFVDYNFVRTEYDRALREAYQNFKTGTLFQKDFAEFKSSNEEYEKYAIYGILDRHYARSFETWDGIDKNLYAPKGKKQVIEAKNRIAELKDKYGDEIDYYLFKQFLIDIENKQSNEFSKKTALTIIGDSPVASPAADEWLYQDLFLQGKAIGCPPDYFSKNGQRWGFKYFNPKYIFNEDGTLGKAGKILKQKYDKFFESFSGGLRIDHIIGLVDPFIYTVKSKKMTPYNSGRIYSMFTGKYQKKGNEYSNIIEKIILQSAKEHNMDKSNVICEDLGDPNKPTIQVMKRLGLSGISLTQFGYRGAKAPERNVIMIGSHDNISLLEYTDDLFDNPEKSGELLKKTQLLAHDILPKGSSSKEVKKLAQELKTDKSKFVAANFAELFTSPAKRVQIFFSDFFGIGKTYNRPSTTEGNWALRIGPDFENDYYRAVAEGKAPNLAKAIAVALRQRGLDKTNPELIANLDASAKILAEK